MENISYHVLIIFFFEEVTNNLPETVSSRFGRKILLNLLDYQ